MELNYLRTTGSEITINTIYIYNTPEGKGKVVAVLN
jgi:hypothetical protein